MRHIISILLQNEAGALARVANMFAARGYNIDSLSVAPTHDPTVSRLTLATQGSDAVVNQIVQQTRKLIDVVDIENLSGKDYLECELLIVKVEARNGVARQVVECVRRHHGHMLDDSEDTRMVQVSATGAEIDAFLAEIAGITRIIELARSGVAAMERGHQVMELPT